MPNFSYKAKSLGGKTETGFSDAKDMKELAQNLRAEGLFLARADSEIKKQRKGFNFRFLGRKVSVGEKLLVTRNLSVIVSTGLSLVKGFSILSAQSKNIKMKNALLDIGQEVSRGKKLSDSFKKYPNIFSELFQSMIEAGEESGTLEEVLEILSLQLEKEKEIKSKVQKALIYPTILVIVMIIVGVGLSIFVLPKMNKFFINLNASLPITTKMILGLGDFLQMYWHYIAISVFVIFSAFLSFAKTKKGRVVIDSLLLKMPFVSSLVKKTNTASLIRSLSSLLSAGVPLLRSLEITSGTVNNFYFKQALRGSFEGVEKGKKLFNSLQPYQNLFPYGALEMMEIGEETGKTSVILKKLAEFYEEEVTNVAENLSAVIEPVLIIIIGIVVGVFAVSIIGPLYSVLGSI